MKLSHIQIENILGIRHADITPAAPVVLFAGRNGAGKSSLQDAIALALTGQPRRVKLKKQLAELISEGGKRGGVVIQAAGDTGESTFSYRLPTGVHSGAERLADNLFVPLVLDPTRFAAADPDQRRQWLFELVGCEASASVVRARLLKRGATSERVDSVLPLIHAGFPEAAKAAALRASEARGAWKSVTGEAYGSVKADAWSAPIPPAVNGGNLAELDALSVELDGKIEALQIDLGRALEAEEQAHRREAELDHLRETAERLPRFTAKLEADRAEVARMSALVDAARAAQGGDPTGPALLHRVVEALRAIPADCRPANVADLFAEYDRDYAAHPGNPELAARLGEYAHALQVVQRAVTNDEQDVARAEQAVARLAEPAPAQSRLDTSTAQMQLDVLRAERAEVVQRHAAVRESMHAAARAATLTETAARHHADVLAWCEIADALGPDGIPGEILADALAPVNRLLMTLSQVAGWGVSAPARIDPAMTLTLDGRPYALLSESERWRVDCLLALAIAELSGLHFVMLDRMDVLDLLARNQLLDLLADRVDNGALAGAVVCATLKAAPADLGPQFDVHWIEAGRVVAAADSLIV
ncbi:AAA family ATPase [Chitiniphilus eburneus]|uniref:AAA family ATPase n=1 Tax=Chitiniphilus eburneus TaxID=2571148 RepID=UPI00145F681A|nr:AAA family ATPase [Chitiniphilus eburneus]